MPLRPVALALALLLAAGAAAAQAPDSAAADRVRTESGIDPTRIVSAVGVGFEVVDFPGDRFASAVIPRLGIGAGAWSASLDTRLAATYSGEPGAPLVTGLGDVGLTLVRAVLPSARHSLALAAELVLPVGDPAIGGRAVRITPSVTWAWTVRPWLVVAAQPQYERTLLRPSEVPAVSLLTLRGFVAVFRPSGWFYVLEARVRQDFEAERSYVQVAPVVGKNIGRSVNLAARLDLPISGTARERYGVVYRVGVQRVF
jgi:hypothetical protein